LKQIRAIITRVGGKFWCDNSNITSATKVKRNSGNFLTRLFKVILDREDTFNEPIVFVLSKIS